MHSGGELATAEEAADGGGAEGGALPPPVRVGVVAGDGRGADVQRVAAELRIIAAPEPPEDDQQPDTAQSVGQPAN